MDSPWILAARRMTEIGGCIKDELAHLPLLHDLPLTALFVLASLYGHDGQKANELAKEVGAMPTSFTPTLDRLEQAGLIGRFPHPTDRRALVIRLTVEGHKYQKAIENAVATSEVRYGGK